MCVYIHFVNNFNTTVQTFDHVGLISFKQELVLLEEWLFWISAPPNFCSAPRPSRGHLFLAPRAPSAPAPLPTLLARGVRPRMPSREVLARGPRERHSPSYARAAESAPKIPLQALESRSFAGSEYLRAFPQASRAPYLPLCCAACRDALAGPRESVAPSQRIRNDLRAGNRAENQLEGEVEEEEEAEAWYQCCGARLQITISQRPC